MTEQLAPRPGLPSMHGRRSSSWLGGVLGGLAAGTILFFFGYAYFYLYVTQPGAWPPAGEAPPGLLLPAAGAVLLVASAAPLPLAWRATDDPAARSAPLALVAVAAAGLAGVAVVAVELAGLDLAVDAHAYDAIVLVLHAYQAVVTAAGVVMALLTAYHAAAGRHPTWVRRAVPAVVAWWAFVVLGWLGVLVTVYAWPQVSA